MDSSINYITITIGALAIIAILVFIIKRHKDQKRMTPLAGLAFGCILAGLFTGDDRFIGYSLFGIGIVLAVVDIVRKWREQKR